MLKIMRQHAKYFYVLFFIVILSFIFWGVGTVDKGNSSIVAEVGKYKITTQQYDRAYYRVFSYYRDIYQDQFDEEMQEKLKLRENVLASLISNKLLLITAEKSGITVSDDELNEAITNDPLFMNNGVFDKDIYENKLRLLRISPEGYESIKREELKILKIRRMIELSVTLPEDEFANISVDDQTMQTLKDAILNNEKEKALKAFVEGAKKNTKIKVYEDLIY